MNGFQVYMKNMLYMYVQYFILVMNEVINGAKYIIKGLSFIGWSFYHQKLFKEN